MNRLPNIERYGDEWLPEDDEDDGSYSEDYDYPMDTENYE